MLNYCVRFEHSFFFCCHVVVGAVKEIDWFSPNGEKIESNRQDITVIRNDETSSTLTIYNANIATAGTYKCVATDGDQQAEATVNVKIYRTARSIFHFSSTLYLSLYSLCLQDRPLGQSYILKCII